MTQEARLDALVSAFKAESKRYRYLPVPSDRAGMRRVLRSLMNVRMPAPLDTSVLSLQDAYLQERIREKGVVTLSEIPEIRPGLSIWQGDITRLIL